MLSKLFCTSVLKVHNTYLLTCFCNKSLVFVILKVFLCHMGNNGQIIPVYFEVTKERGLIKLKCSLQRCCNNTYISRNDWLPHNYNQHYNAVKVEKRQITYCCTKDHQQNSWTIGINNLEWWRAVHIYQN